MTVLAALATAVRERLAAGSDAPLPGFGTLRRRHVAARVQTRPDGSRVLLPPSETVRFTQDATDPSAVAAALARTQGLDAAAAAPALRDAVDQLEAIVVATGEARLPGVGLFRRTSSSVLFAADTTLLAEINRPYAGLEPVVAAPAAAPEPTPPEPDDLADDEPTEAYIVPVHEPAPPAVASVDALRHDLDATHDLAPFEASADAETHDGGTIAAEPDEFEPQSPQSDVEDIVAPVASPESARDEGDAEPGENAPAEVAAEPAPQTQIDPDPDADVDPGDVDTGTLDAVSDGTHSSAPAAALPEPWQPLEPEDDEAAPDPDDQRIDAGMAEVSDAGVENADAAGIDESNVLDATAPAREPEFEPAHEPEVHPDADLDTDASTAPAPPSAEAPPLAPAVSEPAPSAAPDLNAPSADPLDAFLASALPIGAPGSRRRTAAADRGSDVPRSVHDADEMGHTLPLDDEDLAPASSDDTADSSVSATDSVAEPAAETDEIDEAETPAATDPFADIEVPTSHATPPDVSVWSADASATMPDDDLGADLADDDLDGLFDADDLAAAPVEPGSPGVLDDIYPSSDVPADLGSASSRSTALGLGFDDALPGPVSVVPPPAPVLTPESDAPRPVTPPTEDRWFSMGSLLLLAVSLAAIAAAATWPRFAGTPPTPEPVPGRGVFGDTLGDAAEAAFRERGSLDADSTAATPSADSPAASAPLPSSDATAPEAQSADDTPDAVPPPAEPESAPAPAERRTLGVAPPAGTAILPPRVAGLPQRQTRALASRERLARGDAFTWVVLSTPGRAEADALVQRYRQSGYRAGVVTTTAAGRTTHRVGVGQFGSRDDARAVRNRLPPQAPADTWLLDLSSSGLSF